MTGSDWSYEAVMKRRKSILGAAVGIDYGRFERQSLGFDYEALMSSSPVRDIAGVAAIQSETGVGGTPMIELRNLTCLARSYAPSGKGARIVVKDEARNPSGSFKDRRASLSVYDARQKGYRGVVAATSGNYGAAVASQAAMRGLDCIILQEAFDSHGVGQPEILEKGRACEAYGAEVWQLTVGPELFYCQLRLLEETSFYNASLYTPGGVAGIETLGYEVAQDCLKAFGNLPSAVVVTHAGGGNVTGTARGLRKAGATDTQVIGATVDIRGLHMASDRDFNRKSFTTGHSGYSIPFTVNPDRTDVPRNAARALRYLDRLVFVTQGEVFYATELLATLDGIERGPAGNTSLAAAISLAREFNDNDIIVVQETEYTGAGKHHHAQLSFARQQGIKVFRGNPSGNVPGECIAIPESIEQMRAIDVDLEEVRRSYIARTLHIHCANRLTEADYEFLAVETRTGQEFVRNAVESLRRSTGASDDHV